MLGTPRTTSAIELRGSMTAATATGIALTMANASNTVDMVCGSTAISVTNRAYTIVCNNLPPRHNINDINYAARLDDVIAVRGSGIVCIACTAHHCCATHQKLLRRARIQLHVIKANNMLIFGTTTLGP